jgi:hypothetical protein
MVGNANRVEPIKQVAKSRGLIKLPPRTESIVRVPVTPGSPNVGVTSKCEIREGVFMAASLTEVIDGYILTSMLNTKDEEVEVPEPVVELDTIDFMENSGPVEYEPRYREKEISNQLRTDHLNSEEKKMLVQTCLQYQDIFYLPGDRLSSTEATKHSITVEPGTEAINTRPYRLPETQKAEVEKQVKQLLQEVIIEESDSPWSSPILIIPKKMDASGQRKFRLVVDYRKLNEKTVGNAYPLPDITEILDQLGQAKYFSCLDLAMGYHQIDMDPKDIAKTAFSTIAGHWAYRRMPFGLKTAPATFQKMMNTVLCGDRH